ncbi:MAG: hypothetical protein JXD22_00765 [Sedimentisphaerales bacterium]|nr:hypothetical protein [Sedimentisphaerales bacterium]
MLLVTITVSIIWMVGYVSDQEMAPLLNQSFSESEKSRILDKLEGWDQKYQVKGDRIMVPKTEVRSLIARLGFAGLLPEDTSGGWSLLLEDSDIWVPESVRQDKRLIALQTELASCIAQWPGVEKAQVIINHGGKRRLNNTTPVASASVMVQLSNGGQSARALAMSIGQFVSSANNRMKPENVKVVVDGKLISTPAPDEQIGGEFMHIKTTMEHYYRDKIIGVLGIANAMVQVDITPQTTSTQEQSIKYDEDGQGSWNPATEKTNREDNSSNVTDEQEPGLVANVTNSSSASGGGQKQSTEETTSSSKPFAGQTQTVKSTRPGGVKDITATVRIPLAYFEGIARRESQGAGAGNGSDTGNGSGAGDGTGSGEAGSGGAVEQVVDPAAVDAVIVRELPNFKKSVMSTIGLVDTPENADKVVINTYWAGGGIADSNLMAATASEAGLSGSMGSMVSRYGKHLAVSALALLSLFMAMMMVRKATNPVELDEDEAVAMMVSGKKPMDVPGIDDNILLGDDDNTGMLAGVELGPDAVRTQQILEQIKEMVKESPDTTASLVEKWIAQKA